MMGDGRWAPAAVGWWQSAEGEHAKARKGREGEGCGQVGAVDADMLVLCVATGWTATWRRASARWWARSSARAAGCTSSRAWLRSCSAPSPWARWRSRTTPWAPSLSRRK